MMFWFRNPLLQKFDFTLENIRSWGGERQYLEALNQVTKKKSVLNPTYNDNIGEADIEHAGHTIHTRFRTFPGRRSVVENLCPCAASQRDGRICVHMLAAAIALEAAEREQRKAKTIENAQRALEKMGVLPKSPKPVSKQAPSASAEIPPVPVRTASPSPAPSQKAPRLRFYVPDDWVTRFDAGKIPVALSISADNTPHVFSLSDISSGKLIDSNTGLPVPFNPSDSERKLLFTLEHILYIPPDAATGKNLSLDCGQFFSLLERLSEVNEPFYPVHAEKPVYIRTKENAVHNILYVSLQEATGRIELALHIRFPGFPEDIFPRYLVYRNAKNWRNDCVYAFFNGVLWPIHTPIPFTYGEVYRNRTYLLRRDETIDFIQREIRGKLPCSGNLIPLRDILREDFNSTVDFSLFTTKPGRPRFSLDVNGSRASLSISLKASYSDIAVNFGNGDFNGKSTGPETKTCITIEVVGTESGQNFTIPDPNDNYIYYTRNHEAEQKALKHLREKISALLHIPQNAETLDNRALKTLTIVGDENVLNFLATTVPTLRNNGWNVTLSQGLTDYLSSLVTVAPRVKIVTFPRRHGFEISYTLASSDGKVVLPPEVFAKIDPDKSYTEFNGHQIVFDREAVRNLEEIIQECVSSRKKSATCGEARFLPDTYTHFIKSTIDDLSVSGITLESAPESWLKEADISTIRSNLEPVQLAEPARSLLRPYQATGVAWLRYLESKHQGGLLADEMGLGKTFQTLSWLSMPRVSGSKAPALVICPTSIVDNWKHECNHYIPGMRVMTMTGTKRHEDFAKIPDCNLVITSYALIRRDVEEYKKFNFSAIVLDEAQNIKNQNTLNARSVKQLDSNAARLVLTGTPIENSVADIWSIMDFLMPGYLGPYETFRRTYVEPLQGEESESELLQELCHRLREKVDPFMLRRLKTLVAKDLPPVIEKTSYCKLSPEQRIVYNRILEETRSAVTGSVREVGFERSRMIILTALLRLRQLCCHLALIDPEEAEKATTPSDKMEHLFQILDDALSENHRVLIFSQFTKMLSILREEFIKRKIRFCYLDGTMRSVERNEQVEQFNSDSSIPIFLISIKAGGTGLNLTGADEVILYDPWWTPAVEEQAIARAHRIGQQNTVYSVRVIAQDTIEERVLHLQRRKRAIINATIKSDDEMMSKLTWADVKKLLDIE